MKRLIPFLLLCASLAYGQSQTISASFPIVAGGAAVPAFATLHAGSSSGTNAVGARVDTTCLADAYCTSLPSASVSGDTIAVFYTYASTNTTAHAPTVTDDKSGGSSTYTCVTEGNNAGNPRTFAGICYSFNVAANIRKITVTMPVATTTNVQAVSGLLYNAVTGDTLSASNGTQTPSTTYTSGTITTTSDGDLICNMVVGTTTRRNLGTSFTAGSGFTLRVADRFDGIALECGVQATHGAITPSMTGLSNTYVALDISFKAGAAGTAPSGMYIASELHQSTDAAVTGPFTVQMPTAGDNLLVSANICGGPTTSMSVSSISDGTNTWRKSSPNVDTGGAALSNLLYAENATGSATLTSTITTSGTGDCTFIVYGVAGAPTAPFVAHMDECDGGVAPCTTASPPAAALNYSAFANTGVFNPGNTNGLVIGVMGQGQNTSLNVTGVTGAFFDSDTAGAEPIDGPYPIDQNNAWANFSNTDNTSETWSFTQSLSTRSVALVAAQLDSFAAPSAAFRPTNVLATNCNATTSGTALTCVITPHHTGNMIVIMASTNVTTGNITVSDGAANTIVKCSGATCSGATDALVAITSIGGMKLWYISSVNTTSSDTFTFAFPTSTYRSVWIHELADVTTFDASSIGTQTSSAGFVTSPSITASTGNELLLGWTVASGTSNVDTSTSGGTLGRIDGQGQLSASRVIVSTGAKTMRFVSNGGNDGVGVILFK